MQRISTLTLSPERMLRTRRWKFSGSNDAEAFSRWREEGAPLLSQVYDIDFRGRDFHAAQTLVHLPRALATSFDYSGMTYARSAQRVRAEPCDHICIQSIATGGQDLAYADVTVSARGGRATFIDLARPHINASLETHGRALMIARPVFGAARLDGLHGTVAMGARQRLLDDYIGWLLGALPRAPLTAMARTEEAAAAVVLACFDPASPLQPSARDVLGQVALARARRFIDAHALEPLDIAAVAAAACVSRATLYRLFKRDGGVAEYLWRARLELARKRLSDPSVRGTIGVIAADAGFASNAHFSRRFSKVYGFSPRNLRPF